MQDPVAQLYDKLDNDGLHQARHHAAPPVRFRASEASACVRQIYHRLNGDRPAPRTARSAMYGMCGDVDHDMSRVLLLDSGVDVRGIDFKEDGSQEETMFYRKSFDINEQTVEITARCDGEVDTPQGAAVLEIKGMGAWPYKYLNEAFERGGHEKALERIKNKHKSYYDQCQVSMALSGHKLAYLLVKDRSTGTLGLHNEETGERSGIYIEFDPVAWEEIKQRFAYVKRKLGEGQPPRPEFTSSSNQCQWCDFRYRCHDALKRQKQGLEPHVVYPGPQMGEYSGVAQSGTDTE